MTIEFDKRLLALAGVPVVEHEQTNKGGIVFNPHPVICAGDDLVLAHEICHMLAGKDDYDIFVTAIEARKKGPLPIELYKYVLNVLYDWYHEYKYGKYSGLLWNCLTELHEVQNPGFIKDADLPEGPLLDILLLYAARDIDPRSKQIEDVVDLVAWSDRVVEEATKVHGLPILKLWMDLFGQMGAGGDMGGIPKKSDYYLKTVAKYWHIIEELTLLWKKNKYDWQKNYYGEIDWKDLCGLFLGEKLCLPVFQLFLKIAMSRSVYLVIDRSGSTHGIKNVIMDTAIIIAESLRILNIPISILDVGVTNSIVNSTTEDLDLGWFTPTSGGGTPLGEVCSMIKDADQNSYLLIITDGAPNSWETLLSSLSSFPGTNLTFVIGDSYGRYSQNIKNAIHVEPHTIIREMLHDSTLD